MSVVAVAQAGVNVRSVGLQGDPNIFALYQVAAVPAAGMLARTAKGAWQRAGWLALILPLAASVFAAQSRGGLLTLAVLLPVALARGDFGRRARGHTAFAVLTAAGLVGLIGLVAVRVDSRLSIAAVLQDKGTGRLDIWRAAWGAYVREPLLGLGAGGFQPQSSHLLETTPGVGLDPFSIIIRTGIRVHNIYLESLTELGPVGLALWLAVIVGALIVILRLGGVGVSATPTSPLLLMLLAFAMATVFLSVTNSKLLWMVVGLAAAAASSRYASARQAPEAATRIPRIGVSGRSPAIGIGEGAPAWSFMTYSASAAPEWRSPRRPQLEHPSPGSVGN